VPPTVRDVLGRAIAGYAALASLGEQVEDEWQYVNDLGGAWRARLEAVATERGDAAADAAFVGAVDGALVEIGAITDPHRAIDWLSTFPQLVLLAMGAEDRPPAADGG
jgi:hypothetical protein